MECGRLPRESISGDRGQQMLRRMLLHMVESAGPIEPHRDRPNLNGFGENVSDTAVDLLNVFDGHTSDRPAV
jgi:hypothetical protein